MNMPLRMLRDCFEGVIPSIIATLDDEGVPNVSYLSQVHYVDDEHVALSNQFFSKTARNVELTGQATVLVVDGRTGQQYELDLVFERAVQSGDTFSRIDAQIRATGAREGPGVPWLLRSADIYRVRGCQLIPAQPEPPAAELLRQDSGALLAAAARLAMRLAKTSDPNAMIDGMLDGLQRELGYTNVIVLLADEECGRLTTIGSRGYSLGGVGSEARIGEGAIGVAAASARPIRISDMSRGRRYAAAVGGEAGERVIPLPGLTEPQSQLAAPMISNGRVQGVLFAEDARRFRFTHADEDALAMVALQLAAGLRLSEADTPSAERNGQSAAPAGRPFHVRYHSFDDSLFIDDVYLIKGVPGRLLFHLLKLHAESGRTDFSNRELRLDGALRLPELKDNLEARLILLRRRLDEKEAPVRITRPERGLIHLELARPPRLEVVA